MRSSRVPARTASTTARTAARTSSSPSDAVSTVVRSGGDRGRARRRAVAPSAVDPEAVAASGSTSASAAGVAGEPGDDRGGDVLGRARRAARALCCESRCGRWTTSAPSSAAAGVPAAAVAAARRSSSSYQRGSSRARVAAVEAHDLAGPGRSTPASGVEGGGGEVAQLPVGARRAPTRWPGARPPGANSPGSAASSARMAAASTGVETGRLPCPASVGGAEQLGQPVGGDEGDRRQPDARRRRRARASPTTAAAGRPRRRGSTAPRR